MNYRKVLVTGIIATMIATQICAPVFAAQKAVTFSAYKLNAAPKFDGVIGDSEYGSGDWISLTDPRLEPTAWVDGHTINPSLKAQYKFAWDSANLYIAVKVDGDTSISQTADENAA